jgi:predicted DNA-binding transcriptional regulator AlpA
MNTSEHTTTVSRLKKAQVCAELGISPRTLDNLVLRNQFPAGVRLGKWCYWSSKALDNFRERAFKLQETWSPMAPRQR